MDSHRSGYFVAARNMPQRGMQECHTMGIVVPSENNGNQRFRDDMRKRMSSQQGMLGPRFQG
ncbi:MAG: hypothetical protein GQ561_07000 [Calditrichae bacterium]|nr:hypothetical protein [Calditrichia bacterium]